MDRVGIAWYRGSQALIMSVCEKNHVSLWEKSCQFVGKIISVCGKNHVGMWEKSSWFVGKIMWVCRKNLLVRKLHRKIPAHTPKKNTGLFMSICLSTASRKVYLKTVYALHLLSRTGTSHPLHLHVAGTQAAA